MVLTPPYNKNSIGVNCKSEGTFLRGKQGKQVMFIFAKTVSSRPLCRVHFCSLSFVLMAVHASENHIKAI